MLTKQNDMIVLSVALLLVSIPWSVSAQEVAEPAEEPVVSNEAGTEQGEASPETVEVPGEDTQPQEVPAAEGEIGAPLQHGAPTRVNPEGSGAAQAEEAEPPRGQLTLAEAQQISLERNPSIQATAQEIERSEALIRQAWAAMYPIIGANFQYTMADEPTVVNFDMGGTNIFGGSADIVVRQQHAAAIGVVARQPLINAQAIQGLRLANAARDLSELTVEQSRHQLVLAVAQAFYAAINARQTLELIERHLALSQEDVTYAQARLAAQVGLAHDVARAELEAERYRLQRESTLLGFHNARDSLALLMGIDPDDLLPLAAPVPPRLDSEDDMDDYVDEALNQRIDLHASRQQTRMAELNLNAVWLSFAPTLDLTWSLNHTLSDLGGFGDRRTSWNLILVANFPLFNGGVRYGQLRERRVRVRQSQLAEDALERTIAVEVRQAYRQWRTSLTTLEISRRQLELARDSHRLIRESFSAGAATSLDVVSANRQLSAAEVEVELQRLIVQLALIRLMARLEIGPSAPGM